MPTSTRTVLPVLGVVAVVVTVVLLSAVAGPWHLTSRTPGSAPNPPPFTPTRQPAPTEEPFYVVEAGTTLEISWLTVVVAVIGAVVVGYVAFRLLLVLLRMMRGRRQARRHDEAPPGTSTAPHGTPPGIALRDGVRLATRELDDDVAPGDAVVAAWVALEAAAERSGVVRHRTETATEFTLDLFGATGADPSATRTLLDLYLAARYSEHPVTAGDVATARDSLATIAAGLGAPRGGGDVSTAALAGGAPRDEAAT